jgi:Protein of unknown function (DUF2852)
MNTTADAGAQDFGQQSWRGSCGTRMTKKPWSIYEVGAVIGSFAIFWPLGLVALFVKMKKGELWNGASDMQAPWSSWKKPEGFGDFSRSWKQPGTSGNQAFDDYRRAELDKLEVMRRKLDDDRKAFDDYVTKLRHAKDREDFERFMNERGGTQA